MIGSIRRAFITKRQRSVGDALDPAPQLKDATEGLTVRALRRSSSGSRLLAISALALTCGLFANPTSATRSGFGQF